MKYYLLLGLVAAQQNPDENTCETHRACWSATEVKYPDELPTCRSDLDCQDDHWCLCERWEYNEQFVSACGCFKKNVCTGNGTFQMFEERTIQFFCTDEQHEEVKDMPAPYTLVPKEEKLFEGDWEPACETDADCTHPELGQVCINYYWDLTIDGSSFANGVGCYNWEYPVCPAEPFAAQNYNYDNTEWSYY